jgi:hydrogenase maturation protein HypF
VHENNAAVQKLGHLVDGYLLHNRDIFMRVDDSVLRIAEYGMRNAELNQRTSQSAISFIRRSRGYAPDPITLSDDGPEVMGCGADLKTTFTITKGNFAIQSQHIGDMENYETLKFYEETLANLKSVYRADPKVLVHDLHHGYGTTRWAEHQGQGSPRAGQARGRGQREIEGETRNPKHEIKLFAIQHHYAHIGSVMAEHGLQNKVIGVAFDGTGYGTDGKLWGGEFLIADCNGFERVGQLQYIPLPGGEAAIKEPWKTAVSYVLEADGANAMASFEKIGFVQKYGRDTIQQLMLVCRSQELSPLASGAGRLFEAVSALLGICDKNTFEGEAAIALESFTREGIDDAYEVALQEKNGYSVVHFAPLFQQLVQDLLQGVAREIIATKFHTTMARSIQTMVRSLSSTYGIRDVALSGGTFQNQYLLNKTTKLLAADNMAVFMNHQVPCNDACISLGQAYLIRERLKNECGVPPI